MSDNGKLTRRDWFLKLSKHRTVVQCTAPTVETQDPKQQKSERDSKMVSEK
jgi:hypothetical protein